MIARRARVSVTLATLLAVAAPVAAYADPGDRPGPTTPTASSSGESSATSQSDVDAARRAVTDGAADVAQVQRRLDAARAEAEREQVAAEVAAEKANAARELLRQKTAAAAEARTEADAAARAAAASQGAMEQMATRLYMNGGTPSALTWLFAGDTGDLARDRADATAAQDYRTAHLTDAREAQARAIAARRRADAAQKAQAAAAADAARALTDAQAAARSAQQKTAAIEQEEKKLVARLAQLRRTSVEVEQRRQVQLQHEAEIAEQARVRARLARAARASRGATSAPGSVSAQVVPTNLPAPNSAAAAAALSFARAQLGKPYLWGGTGPNAFDCSGLTLGAWTSAGRGLPRTAQWQHDGTARVAIAALQPGDLVFFGSSDRSIHHVGLYVGDGKMIEAPRTGLNIRYSSIYRSSLRPYGGRVR